jgi:apolipoprotein N-acyltransferase
VTAELISLLKTKRVKTFRIKLTLPEAVQFYRRSPETAQLICGLLVLFVLLFGYGILRTRPELTATGDKAGVIQGNISRKIKEDPRARDYILQKYRKLTALAALEKPHLIIWPETTIPGYLARDAEIFDFVSRLAAEKNVFILTGAIRRDSENRYYNSAMLLSPDGNIVQSYDKLHLVPFGEYVPLRGSFFLKPIASQVGDFTPGEEFTIFSLPAAEGPLRFAVLICFEDIFPHLAGGFVRAGAQFLTVVTNDVWFGDTAAPYQHLQASVFRAVENKIMVLRAANTGVSAFIDPYGRIFKLVPAYRKKKTFVAGYGTADIFIRPVKTLYRIWGDAFVGICGLLNIGGFGLAFLRRRTHSH